MKKGERKGKEEKIEDQIAKKKNRKKKQTVFPLKAYHFVIRKDSHDMS